MKYYLAPSILAADFGDLGGNIKEAVAGGAEWLHIDVMDGMFVPSISFGMPVISSIRKETPVFFDVHLMIEAPERYIESFANCGADSITVHAEACTHLDRVLQQIHDCGCRAGVALNPATPLSVLDYEWDQVDMVLLMTVNPGFGGQKYIPAMTEKIKALRALADQKKKELIIEVDGGINAGTLDTVLDAGANALVAGSAVFQGNIRKNAEKICNVLKNR